MKIVSAGMSRRPHEYTKGGYVAPGCPDAVGATEGNPNEIGFE